MFITQIKANLICSFSNTLFSVSALPKDAVVRNGDKHYIYVQEASQAETPKKIEKSHEHKEGEIHAESEEMHKEIHFKAIEVVPGTTDLGCTEIKLVDEIPTDAKNVIKGAFYLLATSKGGGAHEH